MTFSHHFLQRCLIIVLAACTLITSGLFAQKKRSKTTPMVAAAPAIVLAENEMSRYRIVLPSAATATEVKAANVLQDYLLRISGAALPIIRAGVDRSPYEILIGQNDRLDETGAGVNLNSLKEDGFLIKTDSMRLIIAGGTRKGTIYGVYTFLEKYLGCRMYSPKMKIIPQQSRIALGTINDLQVPVIGFRTIHYRGTWDEEYVDWHKLNHDEKGDRPDWGMWVHTFNELVPPELHYKDHPEYYAEINGKRIPTQLCLTNPNVLSITIQNLRKKIAQNPGAKYWSVSQNDNKSFCTCEKCKAIDDAEGSPSGTIVRFANLVAEQFPDKVISTLAYEYGRKAPKTIKPHENVNIMLCSIEVFRDKAIENDPTSADFVRDVQEWGKIAKDIIVWDYVVQFNQLLSPFPNLHVLKPNLQFFAKNGVNAMFEQGNREVGGEFAELRSYMIAKFMWNPEEDANAVMDDFLKGYYGAAAAPIRKYIDEMTAALLAAGKPLRIFGSPNEASSTYLTQPLLDRYNVLFDEAENAVRSDAATLERVRIARLPIQFATMEIAKKSYTGDRGAFHKVNGKWEVRTSIRAMIDPFTDLCIRQGVTQVKEWSTSPEEYRSAMYRFFSQGVNEHLAVNKKVTLLSPPPEKLTAEGIAMLNDGVRGSHEYGYNWLSFQGANLEAIIDLEEEKTVRRIESAWYQYGFWLRLLPKRVEYFVSVDGKTFEKVASLENTFPIDQYGGQQRDFIGEFAPRKARYVKVLAHTIGNTPETHPGAGRPAVMLVDEIVVE